MNSHVASIAARMSLRAPQRESLERLARICELIGLRKDRDLDPALDLVRGEFPQVESFDRDFPSFCFALATGVGKTRLMGAFIAYLARAHAVRHFFVLAPNLTIYRKLIADVTPGTPKYVFHGLAELATRTPEVITGENYEQGRGIRDEALRQRALFPQDAPLHINVFNISKINSEVRGGRAPRIKRLSEYIGESYFDYLAKLQDLVLLMDESHRYRASAGVRAINELRPVLGLELTATPQVERPGRSEPFRNVVYSYPLSQAMDDGFVKEPAVATRPDFDPSAIDADALEKLKLEDGIRIHEHTKAELEVYARQRGVPIVKPFLLVIARDTAHAEALRELVASDGFFGGRYRDRVLVVHSKQSGEEADEVVEQLLSVERHDNPIEVVIHVNMLKEGWDVSNLYTIVPLRAASSRTLVEQSIGRGLRLPFGVRTGVAAVDRLTIVAHDKFQDIVDYARSQQSILRQVFVGRDVPIDVHPPVVAPTLFDLAVEGLPDREKPVAEAVRQVFRELERLSSRRELAKPDVQRVIVERVREVLEPAQLDLPEAAGELASTVAELTRQYESLSIDIPRVLVVPRGEATGRFESFELEPPRARPQPVPEEILLQHLHDFEQHRLQAGFVGVAVERLEDRIVFSLMDEDDVCYDDHAPLLYDLAGQMVAYLRSYLNEDEVENVAQSQHAQLARLIHAQMQDHYVEPSAEYEVQVTKGFVELLPQAFTGERRHFREAAAEKRDTGRYVFGGFAKCVYPETKFQSEPERRLAVILEDDPAVEKWFRPETRDLRIFYSGDAEYRPDFIVETASAKFLVEVKRQADVESADVVAKAEAAREWCHHATVHSERHGGMPWTYLLIPAEAIAVDKSFDGLTRVFSAGEQV